MNLPASPQMPATPSTSTNNDPVDDLPRDLSVLLLAPSSASIPLGVVKDYLLPCLATDTYSICKLAVLHPHLHSILSGPAYWAGKSIYVNHEDINQSYVSSRGRRVPFAISPSTTSRVASFVALTAFAHVQALDFNAPYMNQQLANTIQGNMSQLTSLSVGTRGPFKGRKEGNRIFKASIYDQPMFLLSPALPPKVA